MQPQIYQPDQVLGTSRYPPGSQGLCKPQLTEVMLQGKSASSSQMCRPGTEDPYGAPLKFTWGAGCYCVWWYWMWSAGLQHTSLQAHCLQQSTHPSLRQQLSQQRGEKTTPVGDTELCCYPSFTSLNLSYTKEFCVGHCHCGPSYPKNYRQLKLEHQRLFPAATVRAGNQGNTEIYPKSSDCLVFQGLKIQI